MIKLALKHWAFEKCIDLLFENIENNFDIVDITVGKPFNALNCKFISPRNGNEWAMHYTDGMIVEEASTHITFKAKYQEAFLMIGESNTPHYASPRYPNEVSYILKDDIISVHPPCLLDIKK